MTSDLMKWAILVVAAAACGGGQQHLSQDESFECRDRTASYLATHTMAGDEVGIQIDCAEHGPRLVRWKTDSTGKRQESSRPMSPSEFDKIWQQIDGTGWPNMQDCTGSGKADDPVYQFTVQDDQNQASFSCQAPTMPYPYHDLSDPLDFAAARGDQQQDPPGGSAAGATP
jgi:hypothetical protein